MVVVGSIELMFCSCGPAERKCNYCQKLFVIDPHVESKKINCVFCGNPTWLEDTVHRTKFEIKEERKV